MSKNSEMDVQEQRNQEQELYQSDEVVWAKVKGYPWWPGYVREVYEQNSEGQMEYEVHFFGDNTQYLSSKLGQSKIRKFLFKYREFYKSAKVNRKLKLSIQKAEEKLKENNQNVQIFDNIRTEMRGKQRGRKPGCQTDSKVDSSEHHNNAFDTPELSKLPNQIPGRIKTHEPRIQKNSSENQNIGSQQKSPAKGSQPRIQQQSPSQEQEHQVAREKVNNNKSLQSVKISKTRNRRKPRGRRPKVRKSSPVRDQSSQSEKKQQQKEQSEQSNKIVQQQPIQQSSSSSSQPEEAVKIGRRGTLRKRGRGNRRRRKITTKQIVESGHQESQQQEQREDREQQQQAAQIPEFAEKRQGKARRRGRKKNIQNTAMSRQQDRSNQNIENSTLGIQEIPQNVKENIMDRLNFCIENRDELIETLGKIPITNDNIKEILDLGVVDIVKDGQITTQSRFLLQFLKAVLLFKYFPQDGKIRKKYEKIVKKKSQMNRSLEKKAQEDYALTNQDLQIRKKTIIKLQRIIRGDMPQKSKQLAQKMEFQFRKRDPTVGDIYKRFAYNVLRSLKDKKQSVEEALQKMQNDEYE